MRAASNRRQKSPAVVGSGEAVGPQGVEEHSVIAPQLDVVERVAPAEDVVCDIQHVVGLIIGLMDLEHRDRRVDACRQPDLLHQTMDGANAAAGDGLRLLREFVADIGTREHGAAGIDPDRLAQPAGVPDTFEAHAKLMFDLQVLAYQSDLTRIITFIMGRELSGLAFPEVGAPGGHHPTSHHQGDPTALEQLTRIKTFHAELFAYYLDKLRTTEDGDGTLLDSVMIIFGAGMSDSNQHAPNDLPIMLAGGGADQGAGAT